METFNFAGIAGAVISISAFSQGLPEQTIFQNAALTMLEDNVRTLRERVDLLARELAKLDLSASLACVHRIQQILDTAQPHRMPPNTMGNWVSLTPLKSGEIKTVCRDLVGRLPDELGGRLIFTILGSRAEYVTQNEPPFGKTVQQQFPSLIDEISEASKCYGLGRSTACAFHSIRCLEAGIGAVARCLGIPDPTKASDRNWGKVLGRIKDEIDRRWPGSSARLSGDGEFFDNAHAALAAMQNPWRNATMHLDQKYTDDEAKHVFDVVKGFMSKLASRMDENGDPKI
jgi:hypothetical protein